MELSHLSRGWGSMASLPTLLQPLPTLSQAILLGTYNAFCWGLGTGAAPQSALWHIYPVLDRVAPTSCPGEIPWDCTKYMIYHPVLGTAPFQSHSD